MIRYNCKLIVSLFTILVGVIGPISAKDGQLKIVEIELGYPCPAIPFYHFKAELDLPEASIIEI